MITVKVDDEVVMLRNEASEITLKEFNSIYTTLNTPNKGKLEQYCDVFALLGMDRVLLDEIDHEDFINLIRSFNAMTVNDELPAKEIEIEGYNYIAYDEVFKFKTRDLIEIEKCAQKGLENFPSMVLAILFKRSDLTVNEHYEQSHLKLKAKLFENNVKADFAIPYIALVAKKTLRNLENEAKLD